MLSVNKKKIWIASYYTIFFLKEVAGMKTEIKKRVTKEVNW